jgi:RimJ/RimL family protein N-acetyltransferase
MRTVQTPRLTLEPQTAAHAAEMFGVLSDPAIYAYENSPPTSVEWLRTRFAKLESRRSADESQLWLNWVVRLQSAQLIGYVQATVYPTGKASIAYEFASVYWGLGLAREAVEAMIAELADYYRISRLTAVAKSANARSLRLLERLGFALAPPEAQAAAELEPGEVLACRELRRGSSIVRP